MEKKIPRTVSVDQAAAELGISRASAYNAVRRGEIVSIRIGGRVLVLRAEFERLLCQEPTPPSPESSDAA